MPHSILICQSSIFICRLKHGAAMVIVDEQLAKDPIRLARWIAEKTNHDLVFGALDSESDGPIRQAGTSTTTHSLRMILFAGEVFPIKYLRLFKSLVPHPRYFNLYGPTETNVCTWYEVPQVIPDSQTEPVSIGQTCSHCRALVVDDDGIRRFTGRTRVNSASPVQVCSKVIGACRNKRPRISAPGVTTAGTARATWLLSSPTGISVLLGGATG